MADGGCNGSSPCAQHSNQRKNSPLNARISPPLSPSLMTSIGATDNHYKATHHHTLLTPQGKELVMKFLEGQGKSTLSLLEILFQLNLTDDMAESLVHLLGKEESILLMAESLVVSEVEKTSDENTLFRGSSAAVKFLRWSLAYLCGDYVKDVLVPLVEQIIAQPELYVEKEERCTSSKKQNRPLSLFGSLHFLSKKGATFDESGSDPNPIRLNRRHKRHVNSHLLVSPLARTGLHENVPSNSSAEETDAVTPSVSLPETDKVTISSSAGDLMDHSSRRASLLLLDQYAANYSSKLSDPTTSQGSSRKYPSKDAERQPIKFQPIQIDVSSDTRQSVPYSSMSRSYSEDNTKTLRNSQAFLTPITNSLEESASRSRSNPPPPEQDPQQSMWRSPRASPTTLTSPSSSTSPPVLALPRNSSTSPTTTTTTTQHHHHHQRLSTSPPASVVTGLTRASPILRRRQRHPPPPMAEQNTENPKEEKTNDEKNQEEKPRKRKFLRKQPSGKFDRPLEKLGRVNEGENGPKSLIGSRRGSSQMNLHFGIVSPRTQANTLSSSAYSISPQPQNLNCQKDEVEVNSSDPCPVSPTTAIRSLCSTIISSLTSSMSVCPLSVRRILHCIGKSVEARFKHKEIDGVASIFVLRFICAYLSAPEAWGLVPQPPGKFQRLALTRVSRLFQKICNTNPTKTNDKFMSESATEMRQYLLELADLNSQQSSLSLSPQRTTELLKLQRHAKSIEVLTGTLGSHFELFQERTLARQDDSGTQAFLKSLRSLLFPHTYLELEKGEGILYAFSCISCNAFVTNGALYLQILGEGEVPHEEVRVAWGQIASLALGVEGSHVAVSLRFVNVRLTKKSVEGRSKITTVFHKKKRGGGRERGEEREGLLSCSGQMKSMQVKFRVRFEAEWFCNTVRLLNQVLREGKKEARGEGKTEERERARDLVPYSPHKESESCGGGEVGEKGEKGEKGGERGEKGEVCRSPESVKEQPSPRTVRIAVP